MNQFVTNTEFVRSYKTLMKKLAEGILTSITIKQKSGENLIATLHKKPHRNRASGGAHAGHGG